jgi:hypothetical protein
MGRPNVIPCQQLVWVCMLAWGCGDQSTLPDEVPEAEVRSYAATQICEGFATFCESNHYPFAQEHCRAEVRNAYANQGLCPASRVYDPEQAPQCFEVVRRQYSIRPDWGSTDSVACARMCRSRLHTGAICEHWSDCAQPEEARVSCVPMDDSDGPRFCVRQTRGRRGDRCLETCRDLPKEGGWQCYPTGPNLADSTLIQLAACYQNDGLFCSEDGTCRESIAQGGSCDGFAQCVDGTLCDSDSRKCMKRAEIGFSCTSSSLCVDDSYCSSEGLCAPTKANGSTCESHEECADRCDLMLRRCVDSRLRDMCADPGGIEAEIWLP